MAYDFNKTILLATFKKFPFADQFDCETADEEGKVFVTKLWCRVCRRHESAVKIGRPKGSAGGTALRFCTGITQNISKHHLRRHLETSGHKKAKQASAVFDIDDTVVEQPATQAQPTINSFMDKAAFDAYKKLFQTAYNLINERLPYSKFHVLVKCLRESGVNLIEGKDNGRVAQEYTSEIANAIRDRVAVLLCSSTAFGILTDGSEPKKTGSEKELVYLRMTKEGLPVYYCIGLEDVNEHGGANSEGLKSCIDKVFKDLGISDVHYVKCMVSATADGASVNTGIHSGLLTRLKTDRVWALTIHCVNHCAELAMKDAILKNDRMKSVDDFMCGIWQLHKKSGKLKRMYKNACMSFGIDPYTIPRSHGTRFSSHRLRAIRTILHGWIPLATSLREALNHKVKMLPGTQGKVLGFLKKLHSFSFLKDAHMLKDLLQETSKISLCFEKECVLAWDIFPIIENSKVKLQEMLEIVDDHFNAGTFQLISDDTDSSTNHSVSVQIHKMGHLRRKSTNRETVVLTLSDITHSANVNIDSIKTDVIPQLIKQLDSRFESFTLPIYKAMSRVMDPKDWITSDKRYGDEDIKHIATHFEVTLDRKDFELPLALKEWKELKYLRDRKYLGVKTLPFWKNILVYRRAEFPNMCLLAEICLCISPSNSTTERGFSLLLTIITDRRLSMKHYNVRDQVMIAANDGVWTPQEKAEIIESAVKNYLMKKRKNKMDNSVKPQRHPKKRRLNILDCGIDTVTDQGETDSDPYESVSTDGEDCEALDVSSDDLDSDSLFSNSLSSEDSDESDFLGFTSEDLQ